MLGELTSTCRPVTVRDKRHRPQPWPFLPPSLPPTHLFIHEDIDDWVDDRTGLGQDGRDDARLGGDEAGRTEGGQQGHDAIRQPAQQVADHHNHHHEQHPLLALPAHRCVDTADLETAAEREGEERIRNKPFDERAIFCENAACSGV